MIFKLPCLKDEEHKTWREAWLSEITKTREKNSEFQRLIDNGTVFTCEKHFKPLPTMIRCNDCFLVLKI